MLTTASTQTLSFIYHPRSQTLFVLHFNSNDQSCDLRELYPSTFRVACGMAKLK
ncbi:hypothetical protein KM622_gp102 [Spodoptera exempta nucleopolyhedrovirus]|uniref:Uncharacterized protein n=1 Tax=Spodoptera exempta nucleopolyhedrovirus TaxID=1242863 RepID=A0A410S852_9ABAC|nr:hypothetical protein KM622_gp102 [Spodoptera exempta nucleopolyhedrovirus]QAT90388.1 hypothetical protein [Spodoptera exempta nucleopolyhedrovirus]